MDRGLFCRHLNRIQLSDNFRLHGCYESLTGGTLGEAFVDITGGVPETVNLDSTHYQNIEVARLELFTTLKDAFDNRALMAVAITVSLAIGMLYSGMMMCRK